MSDQSEFTTIPAIARLLRISLPTVYRLVENGDLESIRVGRSIRVPTRSVFEYIEANYKPRSATSRNPQPSAAVGS